ncbi:hypothetical protein MWU65_11955 [Cellulophaga sp. F20128]|uniref:hypothetical protein n=1 Tax=Cellulophaga sp. F20128 TaxID=2926413 RepID=UPI001FF4D255|nr:hypothetical protein [Cellulophaga sp. F20128]MCK0157900.1 hypothetical protein [Cellulophaga sp. F20128]
MRNHSITIPLKIGKNPSTQFETFFIEPANLFIQSNPTTKAFTPIQLELKIIENNSSYTTFLRNYDGSGDRQKNNFPKAYQNYAFDLKINQAAVALVVEKLDFGKAIFIDLGQTAVIENLSIQFEGYIGEWSEDIDGNQTDAFNTYTILVSEEKEQETMTFVSLDIQVGKELSLAWKDYEILILEDPEKALKLKVFKNDAKNK